MVFTAQFLDHLASSVRSWATGKIGSVANGAGSPGATFTGVRSTSARSVLAGLSPMHWGCGRFISMNLVPLLRVLRLVQKFRFPLGRKLFEGITSSPSGIT